MSSYNQVLQKITFHGANLQRIAHIPQPCRVDYARLAFEDYGMFASVP